MQFGLVLTNGNSIMSSSLRPVREKKHAYCYICSKTDYQTVSVATPSGKEERIYRLNIG